MLFIRPFLARKRAHHLAGDDEGNEQRPAIEPAQHGDRARVLAERQIAADGDGQSSVTITARQRRRRR